VPRACLLSSVHLALDNRIFYRQARSLRAAGYEVTLIAVHGDSEVKEGIRIAGLPRLSRWQRPRLWFTLTRLARQSAADIYHFHDPELLLVAPWLRLRTGKPVIYDVHESYPEFIRVKAYLPSWLRPPLARLFQWVEPLLARLQSGLVFADDEIARNFAGLHCPKVTLPNFPASTLIDDGGTCGRDRRPWPPHVLYLGGLEENRGALMMVQAFHRVMEILPEARLVLVGQFEPPELRQLVLSDARRRGIEGAVTITGRVPFESVGRYLGAAAVGWIPWQPVAKNQKNIPTKLFEYMAYGLPVVCSDLASTRPFIHHGDNGFLVTADDAEAHAASILKILHNPDLGRAMGHKGQELVRSCYNWEAVEGRLLDLYRELLT
jgi:glycosyltransferase involved in cell wall biosynthesis